MFHFTLHILLATLKLKAISFFMAPLTPGQWNYFSRALCATFFTRETAEGEKDEDGDGDGDEDEDEATNEEERVRILTAHSPLAKWHVSRWLL